MTGTVNRITHCLVHMEKRKSIDEPLPTLFKSRLDRELKNYFYFLPYKYFTVDVRGFGTASYLTPPFTFKKEKSKKMKGE